MYCATCSNISLHIICKKCLESLWYIQSNRELENGLKVFSSFAFSELKMLLHTKDNVIGSRIFKRLGNYGVRLFLKENSEINNLDKKITSVICVRNKSIGAYSHSAILAKSFSKFGFKVSYNALVTGNDIRFMRLNLSSRKNTSREFRFNVKENYPLVILVDDVVTTGQTLKEAKDIIESSGKKVLFAWTLCDARY